MGKKTPNTKGLDSVYIALAESWKKGKLKDGEIQFLFTHAPESVLQSMIDFTKRTIPDNYWEVMAYRFPEINKQRPLDLRVIVGTYDGIYRFNNLSEVDRGKVVEKAFATGDLHSIINLIHYNPSKIPLSKDQLLTLIEKSLNSGVNVGALIAFNDKHTKYTFDQDWIQKACIKDETKTNVALLVEQLASANDKIKTLYEVCTQAKNGYAAVKNYARRRPQYLNDPVVRGTLKQLAASGFEAAKTYDDNRQLYRLASIETIELLFSIADWDMRHSDCFTSFLEKLRIKDKLNSKSPDNMSTQIAKWITEEAANISKTSEIVEMAHQTISK